MISEDFSQRNKASFIFSGILLLLTICYSVVLLNILGYSDNKYVVMGMYAMELITFILILLGPISAINSLKKEESIETLAKKELEKIFTKIYTEKRVLPQKASGSYSEINSQKEPTSAFIPPPPPSPTEPSSIPPPPPPEQVPFSTQLPPPQTMIATSPPVLPVTNIPTNDLRYQAFVESKWFDGIHAALNSSEFAKKNSYLQLYQETVEKINLLIAIDTFGQLILRNSQYLINEFNISSGTLSLILTKKEYEVLAYSREKVILYREFIPYIVEVKDSKKKVYKLAHFDFELDLFKKAYKKYLLKIITKQEFQRLYTNKLQAFGIAKIDEQNHIDITGSKKGDINFLLGAFIFFNLLLVMFNFLFAGKELTGGTTMLILKSFWLNLIFMLIIILYIYIKTHIIAKIAFFYETMNTKYTMGLMFIFTGIEFIKLAFLYSDTFAYTVKAFFLIINLGNVTKTGAEIGFLVFTAIFFIILIIVIFNTIQFGIFILPTAFFQIFIIDEFFYPKKVENFIQEEMNNTTDFNTRSKKAAKFFGMPLTGFVTIALLIYELYIIFSGAVELLPGVTYTFMVIGIIELIGVLLVTINFFTSIKMCSPEKYVYFPTITTQEVHIPQKTMQIIR